MRNYRLAGTAHPGAVLTGVLLAALLLTRWHSHLLFHSLVEVFTVAVALSIFFLAWNARRFLDNHYFLLIGIAALFAGGIDVMHTLAYKGMGVLDRGDANLATQLWIAGRYLQGLSFLGAPLFVARRLNVRAAWGIYGIATAAVAGAIAAGLFPACYVEGSGLTPFKIASEYVIIGVLAAATWLLFRARFRFDAAVHRQLRASMLATIAGEAMFTLYIGVYDAANVAGHLLRFLSICYLYRAIIVTGLVRPYDLLFRDLAKSEQALRHSQERYRAFVANTTEGICRIDFRPSIDTGLPAEEQAGLIARHAHIAESNDAYTRMHGGSVALPPDVLERFVSCGYRMVAVEYQDADRWFAASLSGAVENSVLVHAWGVQRDITHAKHAAAERDRLIGELQQALAEVQTLSGLLPICANCKRIRDDEGYWTQVESYLGKRTQVSFSHGICPGCLSELYPDYFPEPRSEPPG